MSVFYLIVELNINEMLNYRGMLQLRGGGVVDENNELKLEEVIFSIVLCWYSC